MLESALTGKAADVWGSAMQNGARVAIHGTHRQANQRWTLQMLKDQGVAANRWPG